MNLIIFLPLFAIVSSQTQEQPGVCRRLLSSFQSICQGQTEDTIQPVQGPPGKRGPVGRRGEIGLKGSNGTKGDAAVVDYDIINDVISRKVQEARTELQRNLSRGLNSTDAKFDTIDNTTKDALAQLKQLKTELFQLKRFLRVEMISGRVYYFGETAKNWQSARNECLSLGGDLAAKGIRERQAFDEIFEIARDKNHNYWIGLTDIAEEGRYQFVDGVVASTSDFFWQPDEPTGRTDVNCMHLWSAVGKKVDDTNCVSNLRPLCELDFTCVTLALGFIECWRGRLGIRSLIMVAFFHEISMSRWQTIIHHRK